MICIKKIEIFEVVGDRCIVPHFPPMDLVDVFNPDIATPDVGVKEEMVVGEHFRTPDGRTVCLGMTEEVREAIGIPLKTFKAQVGLISDLHTRLRSYQEMGWKQRLRFLFRGRA